MIFYQILNMVYFFREILGFLKILQQVSEMASVTWVDRMSVWNQVLIKQKL